MTEIDGRKLLAGDDMFFVTAAYSALFDRIPDRGGLEHYLYVLSEREMTRIEVLRQLASSDEGRRRGAQISLDFELEPEEEQDLRNDDGAAMDTLRAFVLPAILRGFFEQEAILGRDAFVEAVEKRASVLALLMKEAMPAQQRLESDVSALKADVTGLKGVLPDDASTIAETIDERLTRIETQIAKMEEAVARQSASIDYLSSGLSSLHDHVSYDLKNNMVRFVLAIQRAAQVEEFL